MNWEVEIDMYTLLVLCIKQIASENLLYNSGTPLLTALWCPKWALYFEDLVSSNTKYLSAIINSDTNMNAKMIIFWVYWLQ